MPERSIRGSLRSKREEIILQKKNQTAIGKIDLQNELFNKLEQLLKHIEEKGYGFDSEKSVRNQESFDDIIEFILKLLEIKKPLIILIHQVEWIDNESNSLLAKLKEKITHYPILVIGVYSK